MRCHFGCAKHFKHGENSLFRLYNKWWQVILAFMLSDDANTYSTASLVEICSMVILRFGNLATRGFIISSKNLGSLSKISPWVTSECIQRFILCVYVSCNSTSNRLLAASNKLTPPFAFLPRRETNFQHL